VQGATQGIFAFFQGACCYHCTTKMIDVDATSFSSRAFYLNMTYYFFISFVLLTLVIYKKIGTFI
jgi:hypothetical protein